jgi:hypothetical protein
MAKDETEDTHFGLGKVTDPAVDARFQKVDFSENHLVVESPQLRQEGLNKHKRGFVLLGLQLSCGHDDVKKSGRGNACSDLQGNEASF